jgi:hypothetical protein
MRPAGCRMSQTMPKILAIPLAAALLGGCAYFPTPPEPIHIVDSPTDVSTCRRLGTVSEILPTNGTAPVVIASRTVAVRADGPGGSGPAVTFGGGIPAPAPPSGPGFEYALEAMRDRALALGATDLYLRRVKRDWSYVQGIAYSCRHTNINPNPHVIY